MSRNKTMSKRLTNTDQSDFRTPNYLFNYINSLYPIEYDGACEPGKNNLAKPLRLENKWPNGIIYSNPPFNHKSINAWIKKGFEHSRSKKGNVSIILIPNKLTQVDIQKECSSMMDKIIFLGGRVNFDSPYAVKGGSSRMGSILIIQDKEQKKEFDFILLSKLKEDFR